MPSWMISLFFAVGAAGWLYSKLAHITGNYSPKQTYGGAVAGGLLAFIVFFTLLKYVLGFE